MQASGNAVTRARWSRAWPATRSFMALAVCHREPGRPGEEFAGAACSSRTPPPVAPRLPVIHSRAAGERIRGDRGHSRRAFSRVADWSVSAGRSRGFSGKNDASTAEERRKILRARAGVCCGHAWRDRLAPHAPTKLSGSSHVDDGPERSPSAVLEEGSSSAVLSAQTARYRNGRRTPTRPAPNVDQSPPASISLPTSPTPAHPASPIVKSSSPIMFAITSRTPSSPAIARPYA